MATGAAGRPQRARRPTGIGPYTYELCPPFPFDVRDYRATLRITPVTDGDRAFVEWSATFECAEDQRDGWLDRFAREGFARWLGSLRSRLAPAAGSTR